MKRENWLINAYEKTTKHMMGGIDKRSHSGELQWQQWKKKKNTKQTSSMCDMRTLPSTPKILALRPDLCVIDQFLLFSPQPVENTKT